MTSGALQAWPDGAGPRVAFSRRRSSLRLPLSLSAALHLALVLALLFFPQRESAVLDIGQAGTVDVVMIPAGVPEAPPAPAPEPRQSAPEPAAPTPEVPPVAAPPPPPPAPEAAAPPAPLPPPAPKAAAAPARPLPFPRPVARSLADLGADLGTAPAPPPAQPLPHGSMNLAIGPQARASRGAVPINPTAPSGMVRVEGADLGVDWERELQAWWRRHAFYPDQAAENDEDGTNRITVLLDRTGKVHSVEMEMRSGSQWLDMASSPPRRTRRRCT
jgi:outer membrane biosynthesis protein TonB